MMQSWDNLFRVIILILGIIVLSFDVLIYNFCEKQKNEISTMADQQKVETQINGNKFKYQEQQIYFLSNDLHTAQQQIKDQEDALTDDKDGLAAQKDALLQEVEKRQQVENNSKNIQTSLIDIKAQADAIKQDMKDWQKDYVSVLAQLEKKMDDSEDEVGGLKDSINSLRADIEKLTNPPPDNSLPSTSPAPAVNEETNEYQL